MKHGLCLVCLITLLGCAPSSLPDFSTLNSLRILSIKASAPEVGVGDSLTVQVLLSDIGGAGRTLTYSALSCPDPGVAYGATPSCDSSPFKATLASNLTQALAAPYYTDVLTTPLAVSIPATALAGRSAIDQYNGIAYLVTFTVSAPDGKSIRGFKRIVVSTKSASDRNQNPQITGILSNGTDMGSTFPGTNTTYTIGVSSSSVQGYPVMDSSGNASAQQEQLIYTWFVSDGGFNYKTTLSDQSNLFNVPSSAPTGHNNLWVIVARDSRGGEDYYLKKF